MKALRFERNVPRFAAATIAGRLAGGAGAKVGPLRLRSIDPPELPGPDWVEVLPRLAGICGSDLSTIDGHSSRYFEPIVSFPFVPGHEVVADLPEAAATGRCPPAGWSSSRCWAASPGPSTPSATPAPGATSATASTSPSAPSSPGCRPASAATPAAAGRPAWSPTPASSTRCPPTWTDEAAVMVEPTACAVHGALAAEVQPGQLVVVLGCRRARAAHHRRPPPLRPRRHDPRRGQAPAPALDGQGPRRRLRRRAGRDRPGRAAGLRQRSRSVTATSCASPAAPTT